MHLLAFARFIAGRELCEWRREHAEMRLRAIASISQLEDPKVCRSG